VRPCCSLGRFTLTDRALDRLLTLAVLMVLTVAFAYEAAVALGWLSVGPLPGQALVGNDLVLGAALLALLVGAVTALVVGLGH
jgi:hypothetical protein